MHASVAMIREETAASLSLRIFELRAWARATLYAAHLMDLQAAVDLLQEWAVFAGLVDIIGQDAVQAVIAREFGAVRGAG